MKPSNTTPLPRPAAQTAPEVTRTDAESPGSLSIAEDDQDAVRGLQLEMQWDAAIKGEAEQHIFGAMMILLDEHLRFESTRGHKTSGRYGTGTGMKAWLEKHAPKVKRPTALRWKKATEGLMKKAGIGSAELLQKLLGSGAEELAGPEVAQQLELFTILAGTSQNELLTPEQTKLDKLKQKQMTAAQAQELLRTISTELGRKLRFVHDQKTYVALNDAELDGMVDHLTEVLRDVEAWRKMSKTERDEALAAQIKEARKHLD